ncbi:phage terminase large subunit [Escherichia coli]|nr:phage terminase large subunit [Escherichia coli]
MISDAQKAANAAGAIATGLLSLIIPVPLTTVQWANKHYYLPKESSYTPGRWETLPFQVGIMNCMGNDLIRTVNLIKSARVGYTKMLLGVEAYFIEHKSRNSLLFQPTDSAAAYSALFDHGLASKSDQRFASIRSTGNLTFSTAF